MYCNYMEEGADLNCGQVMTAKLGREGSLLCTVKDARISERRCIKVTFAGQFSK